MEFKPVYLGGLLVYLFIIGFGYIFFGIGGAGLAVIAGIVAPAVGLAVNSVVLDHGDGNSQPEPKHKQQPFVETLEERKEKAQSQLSEYITIRENKSGELEVHLDTEDIRGTDREAMLYVFAQWARAEADPQASPIVTKREIRENTSHKGRAVGVFLNKMAHFIERHYPEDSMEQRRMDEEKMEFQLNEDYLEEIVEYILSERQSPN